MGSFGLKVDVVLRDLRLAMDGSCLCGLHRQLCELCVQVLGSESANVTGFLNRAEGNLCTRV